VRQYGIRVEREMMHKEDRIYNVASTITMGSEIIHIINKVFVMTILLILAFVACDSKKHSYFYLFDPEKVANVVGSEFDDIDRIDTYKQISSFYVDFNNNLYVGDLMGKKIDKYDKYGNYVVSFGKAGQGPGEFPSGVPAFCADSYGVLFASFRDYIDVFNTKGEFVDKIPYSQEMKGWYCLAMIADHSDNVILSLNSVNNEFRIVKYFRSTKEYKAIHSETQRAGFYHNVFCRFIPGFDVDHQDNIFILDSVRYKVYIFSPDGVLKNVFQRDIGRKKMNKNELYYTSGNHIIEKIPDNYFNQLRGDAKYYPVLCGINIDNGKIFLWRSDVDNEHKRKIDIYDAKFGLMGISSYYNIVYYNLTYIRNSYIYFLNIGDEDRGFKEKVGILGAYELPNKVICYRYNE
jgi:hypothetical protein